MKKIFSIIAILFIFPCMFLMADEEGDVYDDGYVYEQNGAGDQFLKIDLLANFPLNFKGQVKTGLGLSLGYYRFISTNFAIGGDAILGYNITIGKKALVTVPLNFGVLYQPYVGKFEFPLSAGIGFATTTCQGMSYFPSLSAKAAAGAYYRFSEIWSFGISTDIYWIPQWCKDSSKNDNGLFASAGLSARYHF